MLGSQECLERAAELERRAGEAKNPAVRDDYMKAAEDWRDLARRAADIERRERRSGG